MTAVMDISQAGAWVVIIGSIFAGLGGLSATIISIINALKSRDNGVVLEEIKRSARRTEAQTDGNQTASKLQIAISARALAAATELPEDIKRADEAERAYEAQKKVQENAEKSNP